MAHWAARARARRGTRRKLSTRGRMAPRRAEGALSSLRPPPTPSNPRRCLRDDQGPADLRAHQRARRRRHAEGGRPSSSSPRSTDSRSTRCAVPTTGTSGSSRPAASPAPAAAGRRSRKRETTTQDAIASAVATLRVAIDSIEIELEAARERADEAKAEYEAMQAASSRPDRRDPGQDRRARPGGRGCRRGRASGAPAAKAEPEPKGGQGLVASPNEDWWHGYSGLSSCSPESRYSHRIDAPRSGTHRRTVVKSTMDSNNEARRIVETYQYQDK